MVILDFTKDDKRTLRADAIAHIIPHFANNESLANGPKIIVKGEGCYVWDIDGKRYLDTFASLLTTICGHRRSEVAKAVTEQMELLEFFPNYEDAFTIPLIKLARKLADITPGNLCVSFFVNSGSEANETAIKMARQYHAERGEPHRYKIIARQGSYHGTTLGAVSATGIPWFRHHFEPLIPGCILAPTVCASLSSTAETADAVESALGSFEALIKWEGPTTIAAIIMDPIPGSNSGYPLPPDGYLQGVRQLCDRYGILLIFDEVQTGFGKTGKWFACEHWNTVPDIMTIGKGFTGGYIPLGAALTTEKVASVFAAPGHEFRSGSTYGGHTLACAATLANIEIIEKDKLVERAASVGKQLTHEFQRLARHEIVSNIRGIGLLWAIELSADKRLNRKFEPHIGVGKWIRDRCFADGMILRNNGDMLVIAPALVIDEIQIAFMLETLDNALSAATDRFYRAATA